MKTQKPLKSHEMETLKKILFEKTGIRLKEYLIEQAFTRSSYSGVYGGGSNENFELIGDSIIGYHVLKKLFEHYGTIHTDQESCYYTFRAQERDLSALKSSIVSNHTLASIIDDWDVCQFLIVGRQDMINEVDKQEKIRADLLEAIIGACAVQVGWDQEIMARIVAKVLPIDEFIRTYEEKLSRERMFTVDNAVTTLKELAEHERCSVPVYELTGPEDLGYGENGNPLWACGCDVVSEGIRRCVFAHSGKIAKKYAAYLVLCQMFEVSNEYGPNKNLAVWAFDGSNLIPSPKNEFLREF